MSINKSGYMRVLRVGFLFPLTLCFGQSVIAQEQGEAKVGGQETVQRNAPTKEEMLAAMEEMQEQAKDAAKDANVQDANVQEVEGEIAVEMEAAAFANPFGFEPAKMKAAKRFQLNQLFQVEIELIERVCEPTPQQLTKLRIGTKGAVKKLTEQWWKKSQGQFGGMVPPQAQGEAAEAEGDEVEGDGDSGYTEIEDTNSMEIKDANEIDANLAQLVMTEQMGNPFKATPPQQETIWTNLVISILTAEQATKLAEFKAERDRTRRMDILDALVSTLTRELSLTTEQRTKVREILQPHVAEARLTALPIFEPYVGYYYASKATNEELATVLSPAQIQSFRILLLPVREIGAMMELEGEDN